MSFEKLERNLRARQRATGVTLARDWEREAKRELKNNHNTVTGQLERSIRARAEIAGNVVRVTCETGDLIQAKTTNRGARPHVIRARRRQFLAFHWDKATASMRRLPDGRVLFRQVNHPGNRGSGWFDDAAKTARDRLLRSAWRSTR